MGWYTAFPRPVVFPWVDLRSLSGETFSGWSVISNAGIYKSYWHAAALTNSNNAGGSPYRPSNAVISALTNGEYGFDLDGAYLRSTSSFTWAPVSGYAQTRYTAELPFTSVTSARNNNGFYEIRSTTPGIRYGTDTTTRTFAIVNGTTYGSSSQQWYLPALTRDVMPATRPLTPLFSYDTPVSGTPSGTSSYSPAAEIIEATGMSGCFYTPTAYLPDKMWLPALYPSRPVASPPRVVYESKATDLVTVGGMSYTCRHSTRRVWEVELLLDGVVECFGNTTYQTGGGNSDRITQFCDGIEFYNKFLRQVEIGGGCTLYLDADDIGCRYTRPKPYFLAGYPSEISGRLVGATSVALSPSQGLNRRYTVNLRIAEQEPSQV